eukprot:3390208-Rhodomonas_salina.1
MAPSLDCCGRCLSCYARAPYWRPLRTDVPYAATRLLRDRMLLPGGGDGLVSSYAAAKTKRTKPQPQYALQHAMRRDPAACAT